MQKITPHLWFDTQAKEAAEYYVSVFGKDSKVTSSTVIKDTPSGDAEVVTFTLRGQDFMAISAGPTFKFNEAISFLVSCDSQEEIDYFWEKLSAVAEAEQCGWCKDKFGLSWQVTSSRMGEFMSGTPEQRTRVTKAFLNMKKIDVDTLEKKHKGE